MIGSLISAWDVYWVMQLDRIGFGLAIAAAWAWIPVVVLWAHAADTGYRRMVTPILSSLLYVLLCLVAMFLPSSKTAAAMIILPALTSEQVVEPVSREFGEIYTLAKIGLANLVTEDAAKVVEEQDTDNEDAE